MLGAISPPRATPAPLLRCALPIPPRPRPPPLPQVPDMFDFEASTVLGEGGFGVVVLVYKRDSGKRYAMKAS